MNYRISLENNMDGRSLARVLGHPGCYAYGTDRKAAFVAARKSLGEYAGWIEIHGGENPLDREQMDIILEETWGVDKHWV